MIDFDWIGAMLL